MEINEPEAGPPSPTSNCPIISVYIRFQALSNLIATVLISAKLPTSREDGRDGEVIDFQPPVRPGIELPSSTSVAFAKLLNSVILPQRRTRCRLSNQAKQIKTIAANGHVYCMIYPDIRLHLYLTKVKGRVNHSSPDPNSDSNIVLGEVCTNGRLLGGRLRHFRPFHNMHFKPM